MKKQKFSFTGALVVVVLFCSGIFSVSSCKKSGPSTVTITVVDSLGKAQAGATVKLSAPTATNKKLATYLPDTKVTGSDGKSYHSFPLEAVLNAEVTKGAYKVTDVVRLKKDEDVTQTIILKSQP